MENMSGATGASAIGGLSRRGFLRGTGGALLAAGAFGSSAPLLSGCDGGTGGGDGKELSFWNFYGPGSDVGPQGKWFIDLVESWNKDNDVKVTLRYLPPADYITGNALATAFASGNGPDIFLISPGDFLRYYNGGVLELTIPYAEEVQPRKISINVGNGGRALAE